MTCGVNVFIVLLELAIVYPGCVNTKTRTASCVGMGVKSFVLC